MKVSRLIKGFVGILVIVTLTKKFFNNQMGNQIPIEIGDLVLVVLYAAAIIFWNKHETDKDDSVLDGIKLFLLGFALYFILSMGSIVLFGRHILFNSSFYPMLIGSGILYLIGKVLKR